MEIFALAFMAILQFMAASVTLGATLGSLALYVVRRRERRIARRTLFLRIPPHYPLGRCR